MINYRLDKLDVFLGLFYPWANTGWQINFTENLVDATIARFVFHLHNEHLRETLLLQ